MSEYVTVRPFLTVQEAARRLGISRTAAYMLDAHDPFVALPTDGGMTGRLPAPGLAPWIHRGYTASSAIRPGSIIPAQNGRGGGI